MTALSEAMQKLNDLKKPFNNTNKKANIDDPFSDDFESDFQKQSASLDNEFRDKTKAQAQKNYELLGGKGDINNPFDEITEGMSTSFKSANKKLLDNIDEKLSEVVEDVKQIDCSILCTDKDKEKRDIIVESIKNELFDAMNNFGEHVSAIKQYCEIDPKNDDLHQYLVSIQKIAHQNAKLISALYNTIANIECEDKK